MACLGESPRAISSQHPNFSFLQPQNQGCYTKPGTNLDPALPVDGWVIDQRKMGWFPSSMDFLLGSWLSYYSDFRSQKIRATWTPKAERFITISSWIRLSRTSPQRYCLLNQCPCVRNDTHPGSLGSVFARTWIPGATCVLIHLSVKLGQ